MDTNRKNQSFDLRAEPHFKKLVEAVVRQNDLPSLKNAASKLRSAVGDCKMPGGDDFGQGVLIEEIDQILAAFTFERAHYYARRLQRSLEEVRTNGINDINLRRWKDYEEIITDSLWQIDRRDQSGAHLGWYWGNYVPQIPRQMMLRYSKAGDLVLDLFAGSGTTLIECRRLGRHGIGIEINPETAKRARELIKAEPNSGGVQTTILTGDSSRTDLRTILRERGFEAAELILMHPPYHDIIRFSSDPDDLSNAATTEEFLAMFGAVLDNSLPVLRKGRFVGIVIGDKYCRGEWIPLGFYCLQQAVSRGLILKSIVVKNYDQTKGKRSQQGLWRYRALAGGFYVFKHEYLLILQKPGK